MSPGVDYLSTFNNVMVVGEIKMGKYVSLVRKVQKVNAVRPGYRYQYEYQYFYKHIILFNTVAHYILHTYIHNIYT
jgi:hypothetical protein